MNKNIPFCLALAGAHLLAPQTAVSAAMPRIEGLTAENRVRPLGLDETSPRLSWIIRSDRNGTRQTGYEIRVSSRPDNSGDIWNSGLVNSAQSFDVAYAGKPLASQTRYYWSVRARTTAGTSKWSRPEWFETSFLNAAEFDGKWIARTTQRAAKEAPEPLLRRAFSLTPSSIVSARLYVVGLGTYKAFINGQRVGDSELDPAFTPYDRRILYATHDVTALLRAGKANAIGVSLGRGHYAGYNDVDLSDAPWLAEPKLKLRLDVRHSDGSVETILSDEKWVTSDGPTLTNSVKFGETYDARLEKPGWTSAGFDTSSWTPALIAPTPTGALHAQALEPMRVVGQLAAPVMRRITTDTTLYDFRQTRAGWAQVGLKGPAGTRVRLVYGEKLNADGTVYVGGEGPFGGMPVQSYVYTLRGDPKGEEYTPSYSYNGYRFLQVVAPADVTVTKVTGLVMNNDIARTGRFDSSDPLLNRYHEAMVTSLLSNMHGIPTDTPMYEKRGWTADALLMADSAFMNLDSASFWEKWMDDHRDNQAADGGFAQIVPNQNPGGKQEDPFVGSTGDPIWSASFVLVNHALYRHRGNVRTIERNYPAMVRWMDKWVSALSATGNVFTGKSWGDHEPAYGMGSDNRIVTSLYIQRAARALAEMARAIGKTPDAERFTGFADRIGTAVNATYYDPNNKRYDYPYSAPAGFGPPAGVAMPAGPIPEGAPGTSKETPAEINAKQFQTDNVLPLRLGIVPTADRAALCANLAADVRDTHADHITTGAVVLKDVLPALTECGESELAYRAATNPTFPGWGYWFQTLNGSKGKGGEDIIVDTHWEAWGAGARSHNHAFRGTVDDWLFNAVAGLEATAPGYREIRFAPHIVGGMTRAAAETATPLGKAASSWTVDSSGLTLEVEVPVGARGEVLLPASAEQKIKASPDAQLIVRDAKIARYALGSGRYRFHVKGK